MFFLRGIGIMTVQELITLISVESNEILDDNNDYIQYINAGIDYLSMILVAIRDNEVVKSMTVTNNSDVPTNFMGFVPKSGYPIRIVNGLFSTYDGEDVQDVFYSIRKNHINSMDSAVPFSEFFTSYLVQLISFLIKKKSLMIDYANYDKGFIDHLTELIKAARGLT
nr:MAG TPA: hypothetical protein [Caudoviricetes sp.]DAQ50287.1 MAG TPA: hypothetical protein [Caudoviricetes sp.]DAV00316.1 MAG TPA: hypothetical protein [Caudoviricetes sp.]